MKLDDETFSLSIKGEQHTYTVEGWNSLTATELCNVLSDLTGYKAVYIREQLPKRLDKLGYAEFKPASHGGFNEVPTFPVRSRTGAKIEPDEEG